MAIKITDKMLVGFGIICLIAVIIIVSVIFLTEPEELTALPLPLEVPDEVFCIALFEPVCDLDTNTTYSNQCFATGAGAMNTVLGEC